MKSFLERAANVTILLSLAVVISGGISSVLEGKLSPPLAIGDNVKGISVRVDGEPTSLASVKPGQCRLVIVYWDECAHCQRLARQWRQDFAFGDSPLQDPNWEGVWISRYSTSRDELIHVPPSPVVAATSVGDDDELSRELGVVGYPWHIVLNGDGQIIGKGAGGGDLEAIVAAGCETSLDANP